MTLTINPEIYNSLLVEITPKVIETELEYERALEIVEKLLFNRTRTPEETAIYRLFVMLIEAYEREHYPMAEPSPDEILRHILEASNTSESQLVGILGSSHDVAEIVQGKKAINTTQAQILGNWFKVSSSLFTSR